MCKSFSKKNHVTLLLSDTIGVSKAKEISRKAVARYHPLHQNEAVRRQFRQSYGYPIEEADPIYR